jgi:hypothetical protein
MTAPCKVQTHLVACDLCHETAIPGELLAKDPGGNVHRQQVLVEPEQYPPTPLPDLTLLLHLGARSETGAWLLVSMDDPAAARTARFIGPRAHTHRPHLCTAPPPSWLASSAPADLASAGAA